MQVEFFTEPVYKSAKTSHIAFASYLAKIAQQIGLEPALKTLSSTYEDMASYQGLKFKNHSEIKNFDAKNAYPLLKSIAERFGMDYEIMHLETSKVAIKITRCPIYEASKVAGLDPEKFCRCGAIKYMNTLVKKLNPKLEYTLDKFRSSKDDYCEENLVLK